MKPIAPPLLPALSQCLRSSLPLLLCVQFGAAVAAPAFSLAQYPLYLAPGVNPNILVMFDNSESMDATMAGKVISGNEVNTRSNVARNVLRDVITSYRNNFNWGLGTFGISGSPGLYTTYGYFLGTNTTMIFTNDCTGFVDGVGTSASNGGLKCLVNPQPANGFGYITFSRSGDDADVNDVLYTGDFGAQAYGIGTTGTNYKLRQLHDNSTGWDEANFTGCIFSCAAIGFTPTDAGWLPKAEDLPRQIFLRRGWGYLNGITGQGTINEGIVDSQVASAAEATHYTQLMALLAAEQNTPASTDIKNAAIFTPLAGTMETSRWYFEGSHSYTSPISATCQANFVVLATDGNPTGKKDGNQYDPAEWINVEGPPGTWTFGPAINDVFTEITALRSTVKSAKAYDVQTYVIGLGETLANASSVAALNEMAKRGGTTNAYLATNAAALTAAFKAIVSDIQGKTSAASSVALNSGSYQAGAALYQAKFSSTDWTGNMLALPVDSNGQLGLVPNWEAAARVTLQNWDTGRKILSYKPSAAIGARGIGFRWPVAPGAPTATELDVAQSLALNTNASSVNDGQGESRLKYLRGDTSKEARNCGACAPKFRDRAATVLGDIINSSPNYVGPPSADYFDDFEAVAYSGFADTWRTRAPTIFVGANDGMLHAFDAASGDEKFAYVPNLVMSSLSTLTAAPYNHRYNVDGSPAVGDVFYAGAWHTLLVSGLRAGGTGLFALDVTNPANFTEGNAANVVRWEFTDADMGGVFSSPMLVKTNNGRWSVIVGNGYGNTGSRTAVLYVIDAETGAVTKKIDTGVGSAGSPNGLSAPAAIDTDGDGIADVVYAGDLNGNLWKFNLSSASPAAWAVAIGGSPLFTTAASQAITVRPDVTRSPKGGYMVLFGTGQYLASSDLASTSTQAAYGIWDKDNTVVTAAQLEQQIVETVLASRGGDDYRVSTHRVGTPTDSPITNDLPMITRANYYLTKRGWYANLPTSGERVAADPRIRGGRVIFTSLIPDTATCQYGGSGWILEFDAITGNRLDSATFDTNGDGFLTPADYLAFPGAGGAATTNTTGWRIGAVPAAPGFMGFKTGATSSEIKFVNTSDGTVVQKRETAGKGGEGRVMWRVVQ